MKAKTFDPRAVPLKGVQLLQASAGTGKTHSLADLHLRLLIERSDLDVSRILVVTYTNAAASELRDRLRARIAKARDALVVGAAAGDRILAGLRPDADPRETAARLDTAMADYDRAPIGTIHSFCQRVLRERVFECDALAAAEVTGPSPDLEDRIARAFLRRRLPADSGPVVSLALAGLEAGTLRAVVKLISDADAFHIVPETEPAGASARAAETAFERAVAALARVWPKARPAAQSILMDTAVMHQAKYKASRVPGYFDAVEAWLRDPDPAADIDEALGKLSAASVRAGGKGGRRPADSPLFDAAEAALAAFETLVAEAGRLRAGWLAGLARDVPALRRDLHARLNLRSYDELVGLVRAALAGPGGSRLAAALARDYPVAMVDEFQDTDPAQYAILRALHDAGGADLFLIGDPKQSIYAFRGADIFSYGAAKAGATLHSLGQNWRSAPRLVHAVNAVFARPDAFVQDFIGTSAVTPAERDGVETLRVGGRDPAPMTLWLAGPGDDGKPLYRGDATALFCDAVAAEAVRLLDPATGARIAGGGRERPLAAGDLAVLVSSHAQGARVRAALDQAGVPAVESSPSSVFGSVDARQLQVALAALARPRDAALLRGAALTPILGWTPSALAAADGAPADWDALVDRWQSHHGRWIRDGFGAMFQRLLAEEGTVERLLARSDGERRVTNLRHLAELLGAAEAARRMSPAGLVAWLDAEVAAADEEASDEAEMRLESDASRVRIVTIHKSKGLQYPVVFCPFLWSLPRDDGERIPVVCHERDDGGARILDTGGPDLGAHAARRQAEAFQESVRLAYVALTRARLACYAGWGSIRGTDASPLAWLLHAPAGAAPGGSVPQVKAWDDAAARADLARLAAASRDGLAVEPLPRRSPARASAVSSPAAAPQVRAFHGRLDDGWRIASFSSLKASTQAAGERPDHDEAASAAPAAAAGGADERFRFPAGPGPGRLLHDLMEHADFAATDLVAATRAAEARMPSYGIDARWREAFARAVCATLDTPLDASGLRLRDLDPARCLRELPFLHPVAPIAPDALNRALGRAGGPAADPDGPARLVFDPMHGFLKGYIDLVFEAGDRLYLLDYKSNLLGPSPDDYLPGRLAREMAGADYDLQVDLYSVALRRLMLSRGWTPADFDRRFGGAFYLFVRGLDPADGPRRGVHFTRPDPARIAAISALFDGRPEDSIQGPARSG